MLRVVATGRAESVYDITVEGEHEFFANGVLVHNCASTLVYMVRKAQQIEFARPHPPDHLTREFPAGAQVIERMPWQPKMPHELELDRVRSHLHGQYGRGRMRY